MSKKRGTQGRKGDERGQASIMIGMMMMTFILFLAFVINTGMLVNAKINLQNAADLAAYAGAATQARHLNQISFLNYEMRRQYKKFLFRYYVMGNMAQRGFPRNGGAAGPALWSPSGKPDKNYSVPTVCMVFNKSDNFCQLDLLPEIGIPPDNPLDAINSTLIEQLKSIEDIRKANCQSIGATNSIILRLWLWNTDPDLKKLIAQLAADPKTAAAAQTVQDLAYGLGLVPRELILRRRIETLKDYANQEPAKNVTYNTAHTMKGKPDPAAFERTIQAFLSAYYTLGNHTFDTGSIVMDELMPNALIKLNNIKAKFDTYAVTFKTDLTKGKAAACTPQLEPDSLGGELVLGVYKDPSILTYYAVRVKAKAKVLFSPWGDLDLKAYAAAQPFGSRIGPVLTSEDLVRSGVPDFGAKGDEAISLHLAKSIPNLAIRDAGDKASASGGGWDRQDALATYYGSFQGKDGNAIQTIGPAAMDRAYQTAMVPNPIEVTKYNIPNDVLNDPMERYFDSQQVLAFWAPVFPPDKASQAKTMIMSMVDSLMGDSAILAQTPMKDALRNEMTGYLEKLRNCQGEPLGGVSGLTNECFNVVKLQDPMHTLLGDGRPQPIHLGGGLAADPSKIKTSWNGVLNDEFRSKGRVGYSVKFVSFDLLTSKPEKSDGTKNWTNLLDSESEAQMDFQSIRH
ncbi:pilus assembly protein TadG-related protein [Bdellovibrionota bacterium FG-1]